MGVAEAADAINLGCRSMGDNEVRQRYHELVDKYSRTSTPWSVSSLNELKLASTRKTAPPSWKLAKTNGNRNGSS